MGQKKYLCIDTYKEAFTLFFQKDIETMPRKDIEALQLERLRHVVDYCYNNVPFYNKRLSEAGVTADPAVLAEIQAVAKAVVSA